MLEWQRVVQKRNRDATHERRVVLPDQEHPQKSLSGTLRDVRAEFSKALIAVFAQSLAGQPREIGERRV
jgi:hypothetical protein